MKKLKHLVWVVVFSVVLMGSVWAGTINLNMASKEELQTLPGIGPKVAERILAYREQYGPFKSVEELLEIKGIGPKKLEKIRSLVTTSDKE